ncbi:hypothetical protein [Runella slithyformis]|uniref:Uncharacterized protein n=1 Tax=Runella slithyformis (strain ATCC 29530 / DSM 19594 / LMG 11500 / NCIMB 11436 / LSU 4) TaxID=761193 RepID=A0A7U4E5Q6_RUNSL|nr:hypothetical protein [Runella slithyformis]AEI48723.1 hypothetical protein Runsl_2312 [Runella slithyformis DSM 19594]
MQRLTDDELFEVLDGTAAEETAHRHRYWLHTDAAYREYFTQLKQLHSDLETLSLESPSLAFENRVIHQWAMVQAHRQRPALIKWMPFLFVGIMLALTLACVFIMGDAPFVDQTSLQLQRLILPLNIQVLQQVLIPLNAVLLLLVIERILRKRLIRQE